MSAAVEADDARTRLQARLHELIERRTDFSRSEAEELLAEVRSSIPAHLADADHTVLRTLFIAAACQLEHTIDARSPAAAFARRLLSLYGAETSGDLCQRFNAYLDHVTAGRDAPESRDTSIAHGCFKRAVDPRVAGIVAFIDREFARPSLDAAQMAASVRLSKWYAERLLQRGTGYTFREILLQVRMRAARHHLDDGVLAIKEIAASVGYLSVAAFSRQFKRFYGLGPREWRKKAIA